MPKKNKPKTYYLAPDVLLKYVLNPNPKLKEIIRADKEKVILTIASFGFWELMVCLTEEEIKLKAGRIKELFERVHIIDFGKEKPMLPRQEKIIKLREIAFNGD